MEAEYGSWKSPITSKMVSQKSVAFQELRIDNVKEKQDTVYWAEMHYDEGGRYVVCSAKVGETGYTEWTPREFNARTTVHEYGGGGVTVHDGAVIFSNFADQRLYVQRGPAAAPQPLTPPDLPCRYADAAYANIADVLVCVREDHAPVKAGQSRDPTNAVVAVNMKTQQQSVLASGADFYSSPRVSPDGQTLAWVQWDHPNMPWDETELWTAQLTPDGTSILPGSHRKVVDNVSVMYPRFTCDGRLLFISDASSFWNLYVAAGGGKGGGGVRNVLPKEAEVGGPHWQFGNAPYSPHPTDPDLVVLKYSNKLSLVSLSTGKETAVTSGYDIHSYLTLTTSGHVFCVAASPLKFAAIVGIDTSSGQVTSHRVSREVGVEPGYLNAPRLYSWPTADAQTAYGQLYLPKNQDFRGPATSLPPLLVRAHGGPTSQASAALNMKYQYFTSRGFAILDVDYRGSTGYGRPYRDTLKLRWGECDVEDCCSGAEQLVKEGVVDGARLCIDGGSAGGYTTLACLAFRSTFRAGASHYGVADLEALAQDTHKFESRYLDRLIGPYKTEEDKAVYKRRSPIHYSHQFDCPIALFQGDEDKIVPPNQAKMMYKAVKDKKIPCALVMFPGEQHGFRKSENVEAALDGELFFFSKVFGFTAPDISVDMEIANL